MSVDILALTESFWHILYSYFLKFEEQRKTLFKNYFQSRKLRVKIDSYISNEEIITYGIPQGSVIRPTLFLL